MLNKTLTTVLSVLAFGLLASSAFAMQTKHKQDCASCHVDGIGKAVSTKTCQSCHSPDSFPKEYELKDGKNNPHMSIHYAPETVDCNICHREHSKSQNYCAACHADGLGFKVP